MYGVSFRIDTVFGVIRLLCHMTNTRVLYSWRPLTFGGCCGERLTWLHSGGELYYSPHCVLRLFSVLVERQGSAGPGQWENMSIISVFGVLDAFFFNVLIAGATLKAYRLV